MRRVKVLGSLIFLFGFVFGNQPGQHLFLKQQSVFIPDWRNEILIPNGTALKSYYSFTNPEISNMQVNDSIQMQKTPSDASRVTFGKIVLEGAGAVTGGLCAYGAIYFLFHHTGFWEGLITSIVVPIGIAGGTTMVGNLVTEPNGSFVKSLRGTIKGAVLGLPFVLLAGLTGTDGTWDHLRWNPKPTTYLCLALAGIAPVLGSVIGYNSNGFGCCLTSTNNSTNDSVNQAHCFVNPTYAIQIVKIGF